MDAESHVQARDVGEARCLLHKVVAEQVGGHDDRRAERARTETLGMISVVLTRTGKQCGDSHVVERDVPERVDNSHDDRVVENDVVTEG